MFQLKTVLLALVLSFNSWHALGCTPPLEQEDAVPVPWSATVESAYASALTVATVEVVRVERIAPVADAYGGWVQKAVVEPKRVFKGRERGIPKFFKVGFSGTTCDTHPGFTARTETIVFVSSLDELILMVPATDTARYAEALRLLERLRR
jgi:hypothetical protein